MSAGLRYALLAYVAWGLLPLYWKHLDTLSAYEILGHRILWSGVFVAILLGWSRQWKAWKQAVKSRQIAGLLIVCSLLISVNWFVYIWAVNNGHVLETSLGYYMNPLINVLLGVALMKEKLHAGQWAAIGLALCGVVILTVEYGRIPWVSFILALSFAFYGFFKKKTRLEPMISLAWETFLVVPVSLVYLISLQTSGAARLPLLSAGQLALLLLAGVATVLPLYWFAQAAQRMSLSAIGFVQYVSPTITLLLGVLVFKETFNMVRLISFGFIWAALVVYSLSSWKQAARSNALSAAAKLPAASDRVRA